MKTNIGKLVLLFSFLFFFIVSGTAVAQTLQFSNVILVTSGSPGTVPTGKVWKVMSAMGTRSTTSSSYPTSHTILVGGNTVNVASFTGGASGYSWEGPCNFPFWLPAGTTLSVSTNINTISVIEFTVVP